MPTEFSLSFDRLHQFTMVAMYGLLAVTIAVIVERLIFYLVTLRHTRALEAAMTYDIESLDDLPKHLVAGNGIGTRSLRHMLEAKPRLAGPHDVEDVSEAIYIAARTTLTSRLWMLDTAVTAAPLLGLLGTIFGIIDTFTALADKGISDPAAVSRGIGSALFATALGIAIALLGVFFHNLLHRKVECIDDHLKILLLRAGVSGKGRSEGR